MGLEKGEQERGYLSGCGTRRTNSLFCGPDSEGNPPVVVMLFDELLLGASASLKTSSEKPSSRKCCMQVSMYADDTNSRPKYDLAETAAGLDCTGTETDPGTAGSGVESMAEMKTREKSE